MKQLTQRQLKVLGLLMLLGLPAATGRAVEARAPAAELVFLNGAVYTVDAARSWATAVAVAGGRIAYVGTDDGARSFIGPATRVVDLHGRMLLPGFQDSHMHPSGGLGLAKVWLYGVYDRDEVFRRIKAYAEAHPEKPWVLGGGWEQGAFKPSGIPSRHMLDALVPDRPAFLSAMDGHTGWANTRALQIAGITKQTADPPNGRIGRDPATGELDGVLYEAAQELVARRLPPETPEQRLEGYRLTLKELRAHGITAIIDAGAGPDADAVFSALARNGELTARAVLCQSFDPQRGDEEQVQEFLARRRQLPAGSLRATCIKLMLDGIIEQYTGALLEPYVDRPDERGMLFIEPARLQKLVTRLEQEGFQVHIHTIGDRAVREALDAFAVAARVNGPRDRRHHLAHVQLIRPDDIIRLRALSVTANMTPIWARGDDLVMAFDLPRLGAERARWLYPHKTMLALGARIAWGTDWPVTTLSPLEGIETALTRRYLGGVDPWGKPDQSWEPEEIISLEQAIVAYTIAGVWLSFEEKERGSIEVGKRADLVVLEKNLFEISPLEIHAVGVDFTLLDGRVVYERATGAE